MVHNRRSVDRLRSRFDEIYDARIIEGGFFESSEYYEEERERYWRSLEMLCQLDLPVPATLLEIGGGQLALLCKMLFRDDCVVADITQKYAAPLYKAGIEHVTLNLMDAEPAKTMKDQFDVIVLLEVIEHIPLPAYIVFERIKPLLKPNGLIFLTTPNLFRLRNLIRMALGVEFLDRFMMPQSGQGLGHQLEYTAPHLQWQFERAGMQIVMLRHDTLGRTGHSLKARLARKVLAPFDVRPTWRNGLVAAARPVERQSDCG